MRILPVFVPHEGCPHDCVFCNQRRITSAPSAPLTAQQVYMQVMQAYAQQGSQPAQAAFYGGSFTAIPQARQEALLGALTPMLADGRLTGIRISTRPDYIDEAVLARLRGFGVDTIELGAQSMDAHVLRMSGRGHTAEDTRRASALIRAYGFRLILQWMAGLPGDSRAVSRESARLGAQLHPNGVRIYPVVVLKDTPLHDAYLEGRYTPLTVHEGALWAADMLEVFCDARIPVIRIGLNPSEALEQESVVSGAYHPALGEMARAILMRRRAEAALAAHICTGKRAVLYVAPGFASVMAGQKRENTEALMNRLALRSLKIIQDASVAQYQVKAVLE